MNRYGLDGILSEAELPELVRSRGLNVERRSVNLVPGRFSLDAESELALKKTDLVKIVVQESSSESNTFLDGYVSE